MAHTLSLYDSLAGRPRNSEPDQPCLLAAPALEVHANL